MPTIGGVMKLVQQNMPTLELLFLKKNSISEFEIKFTNNTLYVRI